MMCYYINIHFQGQRVNTFGSINRPRWNKQLIARNTERAYNQVMCKFEILFIIGKIYEGPGGDSMYSSALSLNSVLDGSGPIRSGAKIRSPIP